MTLIAVLLAVLLVAIAILLSAKHLHIFGRVLVVIPTVIDGDTIRDGGIRTSALEIATLAEAAESIVKRSPGGLGNRRDSP